MLQAGFALADALRAEMAKDASDELVLHVLRSNEGGRDMERETRRITCRDDAGNQHTVIEYQEIIPAPSFGDPSAKIFGMKRLTLSTGDHVNFIDENTFKIVATDQIIRRV
jgi:hypothetical protein